MKSISPCIRGQGRMISRVKTQEFIRVSVPSLPSITNSLKLCVLDVCNKTNLHHRAAVRSDQLMFSGHFWDLKMKGTYRHKFLYPCCPRMEVLL